MKSTTREQLRAASKPLPYYGDGIILGGGPAIPVSWSRQGEPAPLTFAGSESERYSSVTSYPGGRVVVKYANGAEVAVNSPALVAANHAVGEAAKVSTAAHNAYEKAREALAAAVAKDAPFSAARLPAPAAAPAPAPAAAAAKPSPTPASAPRPAPAAAPVAASKAASPPSEPALPSSSSIFAQRAALAAACRAAPGSTSRKSAAPNGEKSFAQLATIAYSKGNRNVA
jgi:hypothetical protein